jgi:hypothetical protein
VSSVSLLTVGLAGWRHDRIGPQRPTRLRESGLRHPADSSAYGGQAVAYRP